jgi:uncharacterized protein YndB with AHSA1/START domain
MSQNLIAKASTTIDAPRHTVWKALITPAALKQFMFGSDISSEWREGGPITWEGEWQGRPYKDKGVILTFDPERRLRYSHFSPLAGKPDLPENYHIITIDLSEAAGKTVVDLTQNRNATEEERSHSEQNWKMMLDGLRKYVEGTAPARR